MRFAIALLVWVVSFALFFVADYLLRASDGNMQVGGLYDHGGVLLLCLVLLSLPWALILWNYDKGIAIITAAIFIPVNLVVLIIIGIPYHCSVTGSCF